MMKKCEPSLGHEEFVWRLGYVREDFEAGIISPAEFGLLCEKLACERIGWEFEWPAGWEVVFGIDGE